MTNERDLACPRAAPFVASLADLLVEIGLGGEILRVGPSVTGLAGYDATEIEGRPALDFVHPADRRRVLSHGLRLARGRPARMATRVAMRLLDKAGRWIWFEGNPARVMDPASGETIGWVDILRDIEAAMAREHGFITAKNTAEAEVSAQSEFLANMSHEIRTPLNSIIGFMQVLKRDGTLGKVQLAHIGRVEEAGRNLLTVVNDVLDLSKIESGTIRLNERPFSPARLVSDTVALIRPQAAEKGLRLDVDMAPDASMSVIGDPDRLRQILLNLLSNAVKFTLQGEVRLRLEVRSADPSHDLAFVIEDSGVGIAPEQLPKLFRRFTQADGSIERRFGGTGLGLAISKRLAEAMGGSIDVESQLDTGSRFTVHVRLPLARSAQGGMASGGAQQILAPARSATMRDRHLLVAEDVAINQKLVAAILAPLACHIDFVSDGAQALRAVQTKPYALVLMDMHMPVLGGIDAARAIRALGGRFADLPIIALTADVFPEQMEKARATGMNDFVTKPIDADHLIATLIKWALRSPPPV